MSNRSNWHSLMGAVDFLMDEAMSVRDRIATPDQRETTRIPMPSDINRRPFCLGGPPVACSEASARPGGARP